MNYISRVHVVRAKPPSPVIRQPFAVPPTSTRFRRRAVKVKATQPSNESDIAAVAAVSRLLPAAAFGYVFGNLGVGVAILADLPEKWQFFNGVSFVIIGVIAQKGLEVYIKRQEEEKAASDRKIKVSIISQDESEDNLNLSVKKITEICDNDINRLQSNLSTFYNLEIVKIIAQSQQGLTINLELQGKSDDLKSVLSEISRLIIKLT